MAQQQASNAEILDPGHESPAPAGDSRQKVDTEQTSSLFVKLLAVVFLMTAGIAFALFLFEIGFRIFESRLGKIEPVTDRPKFYYAAEGAATFQDYPHAAVKPPNTFRIAVIGDSYSFAPYMQFTDTFSKRLEQMLNLNSGALRAEVINYGVPAYSSMHEVAVVKRALEEQADLILIQVTLNDPELKPYRPTGLRRDLPDRFGPLQPSPFQEKLFRYWHSLGFVMQRIHNSGTQDEYKKYFIDLFENPRTRRGFEKAVGEMTDLAKQRRTPMVAFVFPLFGLPLDDSYPFGGIEEQAVNVFRTREVPAHILFPAFKGLPFEHLQVLPGVDRHPNEIAHRIAAEEIYTTLAKEKLIPEALHIERQYPERIGIELK